MGELGLEVLPAGVLAESMNLKLLSFRGSFFVVVMCPSRRVLRSARRLPGFSKVQFARSRGWRLQCQTRPEG